MHRKDHGLLRSRNFVTMATCHNDFSSLLDYRHMDDLLQRRTLVVTAKSWLWTLNRGGCLVDVYVSILFYYYFGTLITGPLLNRWPFNGGSTVCPFLFSDHCIKRIDSVLPWVCSVIDHKRPRPMIRNRHSVIREIFAWGIRILGFFYFFILFYFSFFGFWALESEIQLKESGIPLTFGIRNPLPGIPNPQRGILISLHGARRPIKMRWKLKKGYSTLAYGSCTPFFCDK